MGSELGVVEVDEERPVTMEDEGAFVGDGVEVVMDVGVGKVELAARVIISCAVGR
jgi:hypothetical protein